MTKAEIRTRPADESDEAGVIALIRRSLGWNAADPDEALFRWKHRDNPFGVSPAWVAVVGDQIVGYRTFMRWEFVDPTGRVTTAVRAVDTATDPGFRGRGIFRLLTRDAVADLTRDGVGFVFNTPNEQSRPGYLKMGWQEAGRPSAGLRPASPSALARIARSRVPANLWSVPTDVGWSAQKADERGVWDVLARTSPPGSRLATRRTTDHLRWRFGFEPLHYRVLVSEGVDDSEFVVFRLRRRGACLEAAVCLLIAAKTARARQLVGRMLQQSGADYALSVPAHPRVGLISVPRQGPPVTTRALAGPAPMLRDLDLSLGDLELF